MRGLSRTNLKYMRQMASIWDRDAIGQQPVGQSSCYVTRSTAVYVAESARHRQTPRIILRPKTPISLNNWCVTRTWRHDSGVAARRKRRKPTQWADGGYAGRLAAWVAEHCRMALDIVRKTKGQIGFSVLPHHWLIERTLA